MRRDVAVKGARACGRSGTARRSRCRAASRARRPRSTRSVRRRCWREYRGRRSGGARRQSFAFNGLGKLGALGHRRAVAELPGGVTVEGQLAWLMWRCIYWAKLPGASRKTRVAISWLSDLALPSHPVQLNLGGGRGATQAHYEPGEVVFEEGDTGDSLFMILVGQGRGEQARRRGEAAHRHARPGRVFRRDGIVGPSPPQRRHPRADTTRPAGAPRIGLLGAGGDADGVPQRVRADRASADRGGRGARGVTLASLSQTAALPQAHRRSRSLPSSRACERTATGRVSAGQDERHDPPVLPAFYTRDMHVPCMIGV